MPQEGKLFFMLGEPRRECGRKGEKKGRPPIPTTGSTLKRGAKDVEIPFRWQAKELKQKRKEDAIKKSSRQNERFRQGK